jgi:hypothetical protein
VVESASMAAPAQEPAPDAAESPEEISASTPAWTQPQPEVHAADTQEPQDLFPVSHAVHEELPVAEAFAPVNAEQAESWFAPTPSVFEHVPDPVSEMVPVAHSEPDHGLELDAVASDAQVGLRDPALVTSPAVRVTPEPLLVDRDESSHGPSEYNARPAETSPVYSYFSPASGDPLAERPAAAEPLPAAREETSVPSFDPPTVSETDGEAGERIPTGPPPNLEALASIPFLTPPPDFQVSAPESAASHPVVVDEVVKRVLERLEPQLHDLISQGVLKPLVESLLQNELAKKDK